MMQVGWITYLDSLPLPSPSSNLEFVHLDLSCESSCLRNPEDTVRYIEDFLAFWEESHPELFSLYQVFPQDCWHVTLRGLALSS